MNVVLLFLVIMVHDVLFDDRIDDEADLLIDENIIEYGELQEENLLQANCCDYEPINTGFSNFDNVSSIWEEDEVDLEEKEFYLNKVLDLKIDFRNEKYINLDEIPIGYKFKPTDEQIMLYLIRKTMSIPIPTNVIHDIHASVFFEKHPKELVTNLHDGREWYFFIRHDDAKSYKKRISGVCYDECSSLWWKRENQFPILDGEDTIIGCKFIFRFFRKTQNITRKSHWKMAEFHLPRRRNSNKDMIWTLAKIMRGSDHEMA
ncbi:hypothetical protein RND81_03G060000 [Saponaria officinalis]|uniref:NAC domain-containing protein n=1 Tax=Saponaria officinalis TaxID=3572 RepID=A0AAW1M512_SAPOF